MPDATPAALPAVPEDDALSPRTLSVENSTPDDSPLLTSDASAPNFSEGAVSSHKASNNVFLIVLTGGPCGGKTTALDRLSGYLRERGFRVFTVPEAVRVDYS
jgi:Flp pilus assembly CpaF family ATPase